MDDGGERIKDFLYTTSTGFGQRGFLGRTAVRAKFHGMIQDPAAFQTLFYHFHIPHIVNLQPIKTGYGFILFQFLMYIYISDLIFTNGKRSSR